MYAAGDCTGVLMLASVAAMQGRIAMWHTLGEAVQPIRLDHVAATIFTDPEIATVGVTAAAVESGGRCGRGQAAAGHQRAGQDAGLPGRLRQAVRPAGHRDRARRGGGRARASELILGVSLAVEQSLTVDQMAHTFAVYPSLSAA